MLLIQVLTKILLNITGMAINNVLLFGSEGYGLKEKTLDHSDFIFKIKISSKMESLNISNSVSVVCHYLDKLN